MSRAATAVMLPRTGPSASVVANVAVPVKVGEASGATPVKVFDAKAIVLFVSVCVSVVPTIAPDGAVIDVFHAVPVETAIPAAG